MAEPEGTMGSGKPAIRTGRQTRSQIVVGAIILFSGIIIGWGVSFLWLKDRIVLGPPPPTWSIVEDLKARYDLTEEQIKQVEVILRESHDVVDVLRQEFDKKISSELQKLPAQMKTILSAEQYERWERDWNARRDEFRRRRGGPPPWERDQHERRGPGEQRLAPGGGGPGDRPYWPEGRRPGRGPRGPEDRMPKDEPTPSQDEPNRST